MIPKNGLSLAKYEAPLGKPRTSSCFLANLPIFHEAMDAPTFVNETSIRPRGFEVTVVSVNGSFVSGWNPKGFVVIVVTDTTIGRIDCDGH